MSLQVKMHCASGMLAFSQVHGNSLAFSKSKATFGFVGPVARARQVDLWNDDPDKSLTPSQRAPQTAVAEL